MPSLAIPKAFLEFRIGDLEKLKTGETYQKQNFLEVVCSKMATISVFPISEGKLIYQSGSCGAHW